MKRLRQCPCAPPAHASATPGIHLRVAAMPLHRRVNGILIGPIVGDQYENSLGIPAAHRKAAAV